MSTPAKIPIKNVDSGSITPKDAFSDEEIADGRQSVTLVRRATGPRTRQGKERSKRNALKHGVLSKQAVLPEESDAEFDALLRGLHSDFQPEGTIEDVLVQKLAWLFWRNRRLIIAENAEIQRGVNFLAWDEKQSQEEHAHRCVGLAAHIGGIASATNNPILLQKSLDLLEKLRTNIEENGFDKDKDMSILTQLYGSEPRHWAETIMHTYLVFSVAATPPEDVHQQERLSSPDELKNLFLGVMCGEFERLNREKRVRGRVGSRRMKLEALRLKVPDESKLDRLLRYEAAISREIERTLTQLERLQRMRRGQPVPPPISLNVTAS